MIFFRIFLSFFDKTIGTNYGKFCFPRPNSTNFACGGGGVNSTNFILKNLTSDCFGRCSLLFNCTIQKPYIPKASEGNVFTFFL
jgi:hypothetical protein